MMRHIRSLAGLTMSLALAACGKDELPKKVTIDTLVAAKDTEDVTCKAGTSETGGQAFVVIIMDSAAARSGRLQINVVKQDSTLPVRARLQTTTGAAECDGKPALVDFTVRGAQSYLSLTLRAGTTFFAVNAKRLERDEMLNARAYSTDDIREEMVWGDNTPSAMDNQRGRIRSTPD
jgi:hypothetical protein